MSAPVNLVAGQQYYIEAFAKEGTGGDNLSVAWSGPGIARAGDPQGRPDADERRVRGLVPERAGAPTNALLQSFTAGKCLDVSGASTTPGRAVMQYDCHGNANQRWTLTAGGAMQVYGNRCLSPAGGVVAAGTPVVIAPCTGSAAQTWAYAAGTSS